MDFKNLSGARNVTINSKYVVDIMKVFVQCVPALVSINVARFFY